MNNEYFNDGNYRDVGEQTQGIEYYLNVLRATKGTHLKIMDKIKKKAKGFRLR